MIKLPIPDLMERDIYALRPERFLELGIELVFLDLDNTLMPYGENRATKQLLDWTRRMKQAGLGLFILSNNRGDRPAIFARQLELPFVNRAKKPSARKLLELCAARGLRPEKCALIGDQVYTDVLCAKRAGALAVLVRPIRFSNPFFAVRYALELPFRLLYKGGK